MHMNKFILTYNGKPVKVNISETDNNSVILTMDGREKEIPLKIYNKAVENKYAASEYKFLDVVKYYQSIEFEEL